MHRLGQVPGTSAMVLATSAVLAYAPLLLLLATLWPSQYLRYRQPVLAAMKVWATFVATLLQEQHAGVLGGGVGGGRSPAEELAHAGFGLAGQLALHALGERAWLPPHYMWLLQRRRRRACHSQLSPPCSRPSLSRQFLLCLPATSALYHIAGFQTTGVWLIMSQGFAVAVSARTAPLACSASLGAAVRQLLEGSPRLRQQAWVAAALEGLDAGLLCRLYALALQVGGFKAGLAWNPCLWFCICRGAPRHGREEAHCVFQPIGLQPSQACLCLLSHCCR